MNSLLTLPNSIENLIKSLDSENPDYSTIAEIIEADIGLSAKVLQIMNSDYFGKGGGYTDIVQAVRHLGITNLKMLVTIPDLFSAYDLKTKGLHFAQTTYHSNRVAKTASLIAKLEGLNPTEQRRAYTAGMMHEIGRPCISYKIA
jgi:HD-like signal output (HDOD) protein